MLLVLTEKETDRGIAVLQKIIQLSGIQKHEIYNTSTDTDKETKAMFWDKIKTVNPSIILTAGNGPTKLILGLKKSSKLSDTIGKIYLRDWTSSWIVPIYGGTYLLQRGKQKFEDSIRFLAKINKQRCKNG